MNCILLFSVKIIDYILLYNYTYMKITRFEFQLMAGPNIFKHIGPIEDNKSQYLSILYSRCFYPSRETRINVSIVTSYVIIVPTVI